VAVLTCDCAGKEADVIFAAWTDECLEACRELLELDYKKAYVTVEQVMTDAGNEFLEW
jgi:hypothetical protein